MKKMYLLVFVTLLAACQQNNDPVFNPDNLLIGVWGNAVYNNDQTTFERIGSLPDEEYAISFREDLSFIERTSGWCGTPPLTFFNSEGTWSIQGTVLTMNDPGVLGTYLWEVVTLTSTSLVLERVVSPQEQEYRALMELFYEIQNLAYSVSCTNASDWNYTPYGAKSCGGPQGYLPYSNQIDVPDFLAKVDAYKLAEEAYNNTWGIVSTCDLPPQPTGVSCINGNAVLIY